MPAFAPVDRPEDLSIVLAGTVPFPADGEAIEPLVDEILEAVAAAVAVAETLTAAPAVDADGLWLGSICTTLLGPSRYVVSGVMVAGVSVKTKQSSQQSPRKKYRF